MKVSSDKALSNTVRIQLFSTNSDISFVNIEEKTSEGYILKTTLNNVPYGYIIYDDEKPSDGTYTYRINTIASNGKISYGKDFTKVVYKFDYTPVIDYVIDNDEHTITFTVE